MTKKNYILNLVYNNFFLLKFRFQKILNIEYDHDFSNIYFIDIKKFKKILLKKNSKYNKYDESFYLYHSFFWITVAKKIGGYELVKVTRDKILKWILTNHKFTFCASNINLLSKQILNMIYHYDFYGTSANEKDKKKIKFVIFCHYSFLKQYLNYQNKSSKELIEIKKTVLLFEALHKLNTRKVILQIIDGIKEDISSNGLHFTMSPQVHAEYINHLIEIKNIILYFNISLPKEIEFQIINMISVLKNFIHKDGSLAYFNGTNNFYIDNILKILEYEKDIKIKNLQNNYHGISVYENKNIKILFDTVYPYNKIISYGFHASTLSFELSFSNEKIISNCGSFNKKNKKSLDYFRYSAAHSTIILNNTNISELVENKSYKRIPKKIEFEMRETDSILSWKGGHDGYKNNLKKIVKRQIIINKLNSVISGKDEIVTLGINKDKTLFSIRFHLTPICKTLLTRGKMSVIIKTKNSSYLFKSNNEINIEESIFVDQFNKTVKTSQIVISGFSYNSKKIINWNISKHLN